MRFDRIEFKTKVIFIIVFIVMLLFVFGTMIFSFLSLGKDSNNKEKEYDSSTNAIITDIVEYKGSNFDYEKQNYSHRVEIEYEVNGQKYTGTLSYYSSKMTIGDKVSVLYDSSNPKNYYSNPFKNLPSNNIIISTIISLFSFVFVIGVIIFSLRKEKNRLRGKDYLVNRGIKVQGIVQDVCVVESSDPNLNKERIIICNYTAPDGRNVVATSESTYESIEAFYRKGENKAVDVYIDPKNNSNYYVDINSIKR